MAFMLGGMIASSMGVYSILKKSFWLFSLPVIVPLGFRFFVRGDELSIVMGIMLVIFWFAMLFSAGSLSRTINESIALRFGNIELIRDLRSEIDERKRAEEALRKHQREIESIIEERTATLQKTNEKLSLEIEGRKKTEEALRESEVKYRDLVETINDAIYALNSDGTVLYVSPPIEAIVGYQPEEVVGTPFYTMIHPEDQTRVKERFQRVLDGEVRPQEYRVEQKNGAIAGFRCQATSSRKMARWLAFRGC